MNRRWAFTIVEMMVVIMLVVVLMGMLLPAVAQSRAAGRRVDCSSRMRQIGMAVAEYEVRFHCMPIGNRNVILELAPLLESPGRDGSVSRLWRCPTDSFIQSRDERRAISFTPTENDTAPDALLNCAWSLDYRGQAMLRTMDSIADNTVMMVEYWYPGNTANVFSYRPGWTRTSMNWASGGCQAAIPPVTPIDVGGYLFLRGFGEEAASVGHAEPLSSILHSGLINLVYRDGHCDARFLGEITQVSPAKYPIWTRTVD